MKLHIITLISVMAVLPMLNIMAKGGQRGSGSSYGSSRSGGQSYASRGSTSGGYSSSSSRGTTTGYSRTSGTTSSYGSTRGTATTGTGSYGTSRAATPGSYGTSHTATTGSGSYGATQGAKTTGTTSYGTTHAAATTGTGSYGATQGAKTTGTGSYGSTHGTTTTTGYGSTSGYTQHTATTTAPRSAGYRGHYEHGRWEGRGHEAVGGFGGYGYVEGPAVAVAGAPYVYGETYAVAPEAGYAYAPVATEAVQVAAPVVKAVETYAVAPAVETAKQVVVQAPILVQTRAERGFMPFRLCALQQTFFEQSFLGHPWGWWFDNYFVFFMGVFPFLFHAEYKVFPPLYFDYFNVFGEYPKPIEHLDEYIRGILPWPTVQVAAGGAAQYVQEVVHKAEAIPAQTVQTVRSVLGY